MKRFWSQISSLLLSFDINQSLQTIMSMYVYILLFFLLKFSFISLNGFFLQNSFFILQSEDFFSCLI
ncbi:CLUMA_CG020489, isoform A [Clunio marinus]|uniref:CLUMA_CG020489, isoform A n=1 Tax=Clunio marinus TaxID=568069 RepID=A0A1J1J6W2_9DIPT|nr:CLUMA_CG020489, isoform A [Clunio marinus]